MEGKDLLAAFIERTKERQATFAQRIGCSPSHLNLILAGKRGCSPKLAKRISEESNGEVPFEALLLRHQTEAA
jgi:plasmid maintenance system antidote protein VapI